MIRTMIVDDDFLVRTFLKGVIDWEKYGFTIIADAKDGEEALDIAKTMNPNLIITDIMMPIMDGIELIENIKILNSNIKCVVLSCHDDFNYVKRAMKLGADEYILKNLINENNISNLLLEIKEKIEKEEENIEEEDKIYKLAKIGNQVLKNEFFKLLIYSDVLLEDLNRIRNKYEINYSFNQTAAIIFKIHKEDFVINNYEEVIVEFCKQAIFDGEAEIAIIDDTYTVFVNVDKEMSISKAMDMIKDIAYRVIANVKEYFDLDIICSISNIFISYDSIKKSYIQAYELLGMGFYNKKVIYASDCHNITSTLPLQLKKFYKDLPNLKEEKKYNIIRSDFMNCINIAEKEMINQKILFDWIHSCNEIFIICEENKGIKNIEELKNIAKMQVYEEKEKLMPMTKSVRQAVSYMNENYVHPITLSEVSYEVGLNSSYLSYLFKQEVGMNFSEYLLSLRVNKAKELLIETKDQVSKIAKESGFNDYRYFCKIFKQETGCKPLDFRNRS